jgi:hypothetical protein
MQLPVQLLISVSSYGEEVVVYFAVQRRAVVARAVESESEEILGVVESVKMYRFRLHLNLKS